MRCAMHEFKVSLKELVLIWAYDPRDGGEGTYS